MFNRNNFILLSILTTCSLEDNCIHLADVFNQRRENYTFTYGKGKLPYVTGKVAYPIHLAAQGNTIRCTT